MEEIHREFSRNRGVLTDFVVIKVVYGSFVGVGVFTAPAVLLKSKRRSVLWLRPDEHS